MKLTGFIQVYNESVKGNLRRCLDSMSVYCDSICVYDDASTDDSREVARSFPKVKLIAGERNHFAAEMYHKQELLQLALSDNPDWIWWMDADEVIEKRGEVELRSFIDSGAANLADGWTFPEVNLWRSERYYRLDNQYNDGLFIRLWRNTGALAFRVGNGLHQPQYPLGLKTVKDAPLKIIHYGFANDEAILNKYHTYRRNGQSGWALDRLIDEHTLQLAHSKPEWFGREPTGPRVEDIKEWIATKI